MIKKQRLLETFIFISSVSTALLLVWAFFSTFESIKRERLANAREAELVDQSFKLGNTSDYLTAEVRKFAVTLNPVHLRRYWTEINVTKTREKVLERLIELGVPAEEFELLNKAKHNSDDLLNIETRSMKLILRVYEVPEEQMEKAIEEYQLTNEDEALSLNKKVNLARELLYDRNYDNAKKEITKPIEMFRQKMQERIQNDILTARNATGTSLWILIASIVLAVIYSACLSRLFLHRVSFPLKKYLLQVEAGQSQDQMIRQSNALPIIKEVISTFKHEIHNRKSY